MTTDLVIDRSVETDDIWVTSDRFFKTVAAPSIMRTFRYVPDYRNLSPSLRYWIKIVSQGIFNVPDSYMWMYHPTLNVKK